MPDLSNLLPVLQPCSSSPHPETLGGDHSADRICSSTRRLRFPVAARPPAGPALRRVRMAEKMATGWKSLEGHVRDWIERKVASGVPETECSLPFLNNALKMVECHECHRIVYPSEEIRCSGIGCREAYHKSCVKSKNGIFKCPRHACFLCKQKFPLILRCVRCTRASHMKCAPWGNDMIQLENRHSRTICWRHPIDWRLDKEHADPTRDMEEAFSRLPLPYVDEEFHIGSIKKDVMKNKTEPAPYVHIKRNIYLVKKKRDGTEASHGCTNCKANSTCSEKCECRGLSISCSKACHCSDMCKNRPFRKEKKIKIVRTNFCGWGVEALEAIEKGEFVVEYIGEVINDALCEQRLWDMKYLGTQNFYMCEIHKDFTIDATFKGNTSRFLNHSCEPNCKLEKWLVDGEMRVGVFASRTIGIGEPLTYDYRFEHFGPMVECRCGASNCQGFLGSKRRIIHPVISSWGHKRKRTPILTLQTKTY